MPKLSGVALVAATPAATKAIKCGYCSTGQHGYCPRAVAQPAKMVGRKIWPCACDDPECGGGSILRCLDCKNERLGEVNPTDWMCVDRDACQAEQASRLANSLASLQIKEYVMPTKTAKAAVAKREPKAKAEPQPCACSDDCDSTTRGTFAPGHDARLVKFKVAEVIEAKHSARASLAAVKDAKARGASDVLIDKLERALALAKAKTATGTVGAADKRAATAAKKAAAGAKPAAKKATSGKASVAPVETPDSDEGDDDF